MTTKKKESLKTVESRLSEIEEALESLLSTSIKQMQTISDLHATIINEIPRLKEKVALLEKKLT